MKKLLASIVGVAVGEVMQEGIYISAGFGRSENGKLETHFMTSSWENRHLHNLPPKTLAEAAEYSYIDRDGDTVRVYNPKEKRR